MARCVFVFKVRPTSKPLTLNPRHGIKMDPSVRVHVTAARAQRCVYVDVGVCVSMAP